MARKICHGNCGQIHQPYREGQEAQLAALGLVLNAVVLWNTRYLDADHVVSVDITTPPVRSGSHWSFEDLELDPFVL
ncbi:MAG: Tn3 family transposase, partial [Mycobacteriales bacterium]